MKKAQITYTRLNRMTAVLKTYSRHNLRSLNGHLLVDEAERQLLFEQYPPRGPRSRELMRTTHSRLVCRPDGNYTLTFRFSPNEDHLRHMLVREMVSITLNL
jgi:hypothetical protein